MSANASDQIDSRPSPFVDRRQSLSSPCEETHVPQSENIGELLTPLSIDFTNEADTRQLTNHAQYAGQLTNFLGSNFPPVICPETSDRQACFCLPQWNQTQGKLDLQAFHLPGVRMATFEDGEHLTWWCGCTYSLESARDIFANKDFPDRSSAWLEGRAQKCCHLKALEASCSYVAAYAASFRATEISE